MKDFILVGELPVSSWAQGRSLGGTMGTCGPLLDFPIKGLELKKEKNITRPAFLEYKYRKKIWKILHHFAY